MSTSLVGRHLTQHHLRKLGIDQDVESIDSESSGTQRLKLKRLQSAREDEGVWACKNCGYRYDEPHPRARVRREHKKICPGPGRSAFGRSKEGEARSRDDRPAVSGYVQPDLPLRAREDAFTDTSTTESTPIPDTRTEEREDSTGKKEPIEERERASEGHEAIVEPVTEGPGDRDSGDNDEDKKLDEMTEVQSIISEEVPSASVSQRSESVDEALDSEADQGGQLPAADSVNEAAAASGNKAEQLPAETTVERAEESGRNEPLGELGAGGVLDEGLQRGGSRGTSVTDEYESEYDTDQHVRENEILSSEDGDDKKQESVHSEEEYNSEELIDVEAPTTGKKEASSPKDQTGIRSDFARPEFPEITPAEDVRGDTTSSTSTQRREEFDVVLMLRQQNVFDIFCPICGSDITRRIIIRKKKRTFVSKEGLRRRQTTLEPSTLAGEERTKDGKKSTASGSDEDEDETWLERCLGYFYPRFRRRLI